MINGRKAANAMGGKTARACDGCLRKRARWFCAADDAFLCQVCDSSVHSANQLASRHERVRLETASSKTGLIHKTEDSPPSWHQGFTRKARTPRHHSNKSMLVQQELKRDKEDKNMMINNPIPLVPELSSEEEGNMLGDEKDDQLLCRVPVFDPFEAELCDILTSEEGNNMVATDHDDNYGHDGTCPANDLDNIQGFLPSDLDLAEFAADVENLLGAGLDEDYNSPNDVKDIERLFDRKEEDDNENFDLVSDQAVVKIKDELEMETIADCHFDQEFHMSRVSLMDWNFDYESPMTADDEEEEKAVPVMAEAEVITASGGSKKEMKRNISLRLNYEAVITAWATQGSPWTTGSRPELNPDDDCWPNCTDACRKDGEGHRQYGGIGVQKVAGGDGGREARVMRYKEKRRTRLFSKKIRYEVRKLNAEKRPRMKGRFVKRTPFIGAPAAFPAATAYLNNNK